MKTALLAGIAVLVIAAWGCERRAANGGPAQVSAAFLAAYNARDIAGLTALYAEDAELLPPDVPSIKGRSAIEAVFREKFEQQVVMELTSIDSGASGLHGFDTGHIAVTVTILTGALTSSEASILPC